VRPARPAAGADDELGGPLGAGEANESEAGVGRGDLVVVAAEVEQQAGRPDLESAFLELAGIPAKDRSA